MVERIGPHYFLGEPSTGFEGKGFLAAGIAEATEEYMLQLQKIATRATRFKVRASPDVRVNRTTGNINFQMTSNLKPAITTWVAKIRREAVAALALAAEVGVSVAISTYENAPKTADPPGVVKPSSKTDMLDISTNIGYETFQNGDIYGVTIGPMVPSVKMMAQELGLFEGGL